MHSGRHMDQANLPGPGDYATAPRTTHANDPRVLDSTTDALDEAHQRIVTRLIEGDTFCKVRIEDVFDDLIQRDRPLAIEFLVRLCGNAFLPSKDKDDNLERDCAQKLHDFVEANDYL